MTREEARKAAEVMLAYADGKQVEYKVRGGDEWRPINELDTPLFDWNSTKYRIKLESTYRPFKNKEECWAEMQKHQPLGWIKTNHTLGQILTITVDFIDFAGITLNYNEALNEVQFIDGSPFGIQEE